MKSILSYITFGLLFFAMFIVGCAEETQTKTKVKTKLQVQQLKQYSQFYYPIKDKNVSIPKQQIVYLPVYSHVYTSEERYEPMGVTISIRNTDLHENLILTNVSYYNTGGDLLESYVTQPHILKPMASIDFVVAISDMRGGSGANFIIEWGGEIKLSNPVIQAVMVNNSGNRAFSFITNGVTVN